ncbi:MAG: hypothetical protein V4706_01630 [Pseudomonadota bacterium]
MTTETVATATLDICAALPATYDAPAYAALSWTAIGELTDIGSVKGRQYNTATHAPISSAQQTEKKASYKLGKADMTVGWDDNDAGQLLVRAAADHPTAVNSFRLTKQNGKIRYFTAQVTDCMENLGTVDNVVQGKFSLLRQTNTIDA